MRHKLLKSISIFLVAVFLWQNQSHPTYAVGWGSSLLRPLGVEERKDVMSLVEAMSQMPYTPEWLDRPILADGRTLRQMIVADRELNEFIETLSPQLGRKTREKLILRHTVYSSSSYDDAEHILSEGFNSKRLRDDREFGKSVWTLVGPHEGSLVSVDPNFNIEFEGYTIEESGQESVGVKVFRFVNGHFSKLLLKLRLSKPSDNSTFSGYIYDLILKMHGIDAVWCYSRFSTPLSIRLFQVKEFRIGRAVKKLSLITRPQLSPPPKATLSAI